MSENTLILSAGGIKSIAQLGYLCKENIYNKDNIKFFIGTSAGSILSTLLAIGYSPEELKDIVFNEKVIENQMKKIDKKWIISKAYNLLKNYGMYDSSLIETMLEDLIKRKTSKSGYTFKQLYNDTGKILIINGTCLNTHSSTYFNYIDNPDLEISKASRMSSSVPLFFTKYRFNKLEYVDGGITCYFPRFYLENNCEKYGICREDIKMLGIHVLVKNYDNDKEYYHGTDNITSFVSFISSFIQTMLDSVKMEYMDEDYWKDVVCIELGDVIKDETTINSKVIKDLFEFGLNV